MANSSEFWEVFPTLRVKRDLRDLFADVQVSRIVFTNNRTILQIYTESRHLIHKQYIYAMEEAITEEVCQNTSVTARIHEHYTLSSQYNTESLMHEYYDSIVTELWHQSPVLGSFLKSAQMLYPQDGEIVVRLEDSCVSRGQGDIIARGLTNIFEKRCGIPCTFEIDYSLEHKERAKAIVDDYAAMSAQDRNVRWESTRGQAPAADAGNVDLPWSPLPQGSGAGMAGSQDGQDPRSRGTAMAEAGGIPAPLPDPEDPAYGGRGQEPALSEADRAAMDAAFIASMTGEMTEQDEGRAVPAQAPATPPARAAQERDAVRGRGRGRDNGRGFIRSNNPDVICGREFEDTATPIADIVGDGFEVTVRGRIIKSERRDIKNNKTIVKFSLTDQTDSIGCKIFAPTEMADGLMERLAPGKYVKIKGICKEDTFDHETVISSPTGVMSIPSFETTREDHYSRKRVELHMHTKMSEMDAVTECTDLVKQAYKWGMPAVAITDHGNVQAFPDANHFVCDKFDEVNKQRKEQGLAPIDRQDFFKVIYGVECYLVDDLARIVTFGNVMEDPAFLDERGNAIAAESYDLSSGRFVVFDLETTGFSASKDRIIEIGAVRYENGQIGERFAEFINPQIPIPYRITQVTSITDEMVMNAQTVEEVLPRFLAFCKGCIVVGHNVQFDIGFIRANARRLGLPCPLTTIDTIGMARVVLPGHNSYKLDAVGKLLNIVNPHHHRAIDDAETTARIYDRLLSMFMEGENGARTLGDINARADNNPDIIKRLRPYHCILLAQNTIGRVNLYRMISASHLTYYHKKPKIPKSMLTQYREGILVGSACVAGELMQALISDRSDETIAEIVQFYDYLEIQPRGNNAFLIAAPKPESVQSMEDVLELNRRIVRLGETFHKPVVATCDVHFMNPEDQIYREILQDNMHGNDTEDPAPLYLRTTDEMMEEFSYLGSDKCEEVVITNTNRIADMIDAISPVRPDKCPPIIENSDEQLRTICYAKAHELYGDPLPALVEQRLERELNSIIKNGYSVMYIIAQKLVWKSVEDGYLVGSRGSVGSSFAAFTAGITEVNALPPHYYCPACQYTDFDSEFVQKYVKASQTGFDMPDKVCPRCGAPLRKDGFNIPFETFLGFKGDKEPDIDLNFSGEYQAKAHAYTKVIFGDKQTFKAGTVGTVADKTAFGYVKGYCERHGIAKRKCEMERLSLGMVGVKRATGQHPGGIVVLPVGEEIDTFTPVQHPANDMTTPIVTTHFDYHSIDHNLLKLDILGHDDPTMIRMLQDITGINPIELPLDDPGVMGLFQGLETLGITPEQNGGVKVGTLGVPELGTRFVMGMVESTRPSSMSELLKISGLSHGTDVYIGNADTLIKEGKCTLATCIGCRDDIMVYLINAGLDPSESFKIMENVRKGKVAKGKCKEWDEWKQDMLDHGVPDWYIWSCELIKYMFPKGHAAAYVMMALRIAWFKVHRPLAYYCAYYSIRMKTFDYENMAQGPEHLLQVMQEYTVKTENKTITAAEADQLDDMRVVREMYARGIRFAPIDLNRAKARDFIIIDEERQIIMPAFNTISGMGDKAADQLEEAVKQGPFVSRQDVRDRARISSTIVEKMGALGLLGNLPESNQFSLFDLMPGMTLNN